jgi:hypothetical protein
VAFGNYYYGLTVILAAQLNLHFMKTLPVIAVLLCSTASAFCQASWTYHVGFALNDRSGRQIHDSDITSGKCRVFIDKGSPDQVVNYVSTLGLFYITGSATYPSVSIGLINGSDSTEVVLPVGSERVILTNWPTNPGTYFLEIDETHSIKHPEAVLCYPTQFRRGTDALFSLTVLDWNQYRVDPASRSMSRADGFKVNRMVKVQIH